LNDASARKIPHLRVILLLVLAAAKGAAADQFQDSTKLYRAGRSAEAQYERAARRLAPLGTARAGSGSCDEIVGRFCIYYDAGRDTLPTEPLEIGRARDRAIEALRAAFAANNARQATAFALIRLLLEGSRPQEALEIAESFRRASSDVATGHMLLGLTRHASADIPGAERAFVEWLSVLDSSRAREVTDVSVLLSSRERHRYQRLSGAQLREYHERFWRYADALYLTRGNETYTEHLSRYAAIQLLEAAPVVMGSTSWGDDMAELTVRYGTIKARTRGWTRGLGLGASDLSITEHWDPEQVIYAAPALDSALNVRARPGGGWPLDTVRTISGHAPSTLRRMLPIEHLAAVFPGDSGERLRVDAVLPLDARARPDPSGRAVLFALDSTLQVLAAAPGFIRVERDSMFVWSEVKLPAGARFYSMEVFEQNSRLAGRARFPIPRGPDNSLMLSDLLMAEPFATGRLPRTQTDAWLKPLPTALVPAGGSVGIYAEAIVDGERPRNLRIRLRILGAKRREARIAISWIDEVRTEGPTPIAATISLEKLKPGRYLMELSVTDQDGRTGMTTREFVIVEP
jgi:hypothetical protein